MPYSLALTAGAQAQNEGNPGGAAGTWTYTLTRSGADINGVDQTYGLRVFNADTTPSDDFTGLTSGNRTFIWTGGATTTTVTFTANPDVTVEPNENPVIWFFSNATSTGVQILSNQDVSTNVITLTNDDTGAPVFSTAAAVNAAENATTAVTLAATAGGTAVTYTKTGAGADQALFTVNPTTGEVTWAAQNFEAPGDAGADRVYNVQVRATAGGATTDLDLAITLTNVNEAPVVTGGAGPVATAIAENTTAVATVAATDVDAGDSLTWSISGGADASKFTINSLGQLAFATAPNFETPTDVGADNIYNVTVRATDAGGLFSEQAHAITVNNADDPAVISSYGGADLLFLSAVENTTTTTTLATVVAADNDVGGDGHLLAGRS